MKLADEILLLESLSADRIGKAIKAFSKSKGKSKTIEDAIRVILVDLKAIRKKVTDSKLIFKIDRDITNASNILKAFGAPIPKTLDVPS